MSLRNSEDATHYLHCTHCQGRSVKHYKMRCILLGKTKAGKAKVVVFGERNWAGRDDIQRVRYVDMDRLTMMPIPTAINNSKNYGSTEYCV